MRRFIASLFACLVSALALPALSAPLPVSVSLPPQGWLLQKLGGPLVEGQVLADKGQDPHLFEPTPKQVATLAKAKIYFTLGLPFEKALTAKLAKNGSGPRVIDSGKGVDKIAMAEHRHEHEHGTAHDKNHRHDSQKSPKTFAHNHLKGAGSDPHIWLSSRNLIRMAESMRDSLAEVDPVHAATYHTNAGQLIDELSSADREIALQLAPFKGATFYVFHPAFGYFAHDYGLVQEAVELGGKSPSPKQLNAVIARAREDKVQVLFVQPQFDSTSAAVVAEAIGGRVEALDPLAADVIANLRRMATAIAAAQAR